MTIARRSVLLGGMSTSAIWLSGCVSSGEPKAPDVPLLSKVRISEVAVNTLPRRGRPNIKTVPSEKTDRFTDEVVARGLQRVMNANLVGLGAGSPMKINVTLREMTLGEPFGVFALPTNMIGTLSGTSQTPEGKVGVIGTLQAERDNKIGGNDFDAKIQDLYQAFSDVVEEELRSLEFEPT